MKLEVGMYVRTILGISKLVEIKEFDTIYVFDKLDDDLWTDDIANEIWKFELKDIIVKASFDIMDLIEVGDIISFYEDIDNYKKEYAIRIANLIILDKAKDKISNDNIRLISIVTKEQFENMEYRIGE